ncbi:MAG: GNAT family N-acetyltransferase [Clostridia bacterium]|nr:GNAT family N-acetyltransferase [Clostridia bacterium]
MESEKFTLKFAETAEERNAVYALRYRDMILEYRPENVKEDGLDISPADAFAKHAMCIDNATGDVVGSYRIITSDSLPEHERFVCEDEFDISALKATGESIAELSRAVVKREYRNSVVLMLLLRFVVKYLREQNYRFVIGEASFLGTDKTVRQNEFSYLAAYHAITDFDIRSLEKEQIGLLPKEALDAPTIKRSLPPLIRAYLGFGAKVSRDSFTDREFGSVDVFILLDSENYNDAYINRLLRL